MVLLVSFYTAQTNKKGVLEFDSYCFSFKNTLK